VVEPLDVFRSAYIEGTALFNSHEFDRAFAGLSDSVAWYPMAGWRALGVLGADVLEGREAVAAAYVELLDDFPDWHSEPLEFVQVSERVFVVDAVSRGRGRASGTPVTVPVSQVWEFSGDGVVVRVREYATHDEALAAARAA
jgi:SnoaL-like domain